MPGSGSRPGSGSGSGLSFLAGSGFNEYGSETLKTRDPNPQLGTAMQRVDDDNWIHLTRHKVLRYFDKKNQGGSSYQEYNHHEAVEDGEPVDSVLEKVWIQIFVETILKRRSLEFLTRHGTMRGGLLTYYKLTNWPKFIKRFIPVRYCNKNHRFQHRFQFQNTSWYGYCPLTTRKRKDYL